MAEKQVNEIPGPLRANYEKGLQAIQRDNLEYALELLWTVVEKEPTFFQGRQALRRAAATKAGKNKSMFKKVMNSAGGSAYLAKAQIELKSNPLAALNEVEKYLMGDPGSVSAHRIAGDAALACELTETARFSLQIVNKLAPKDREAAEKLAVFHVAQGEVEKAEAVYDALIRHYPGDPALSMKAKNVSASKTMTQGGYENASREGGTFRDALKNKDEADSLEQEHRLVKDSETAARLIAEYERRLESEPENVKLVRELADLCALTEDYYRSLEYYNMLETMSGGIDSLTEKARADVTVKRLNQYIEHELDPNAEDYEEQKSDLVRQRDEFIIGDCRQRVDKYPTDMNLRYEYGKLLFDAGKIGDAIKELQKAQVNQHVRFASMLLLAKCFSHRKMNDMAARKLKEAIDEKPEMDSVKKGLVYEYGNVLEEMGQMEEAIEQYKQIYEVDIDYQDVAKRVDDYYDSQG